MPTSSDFRRELRVADARYYELTLASRRAGDGEVLLSERRRVPTLATGIVAGLCLVWVGEVMYTRPAPRIPPPDPAPISRHVPDLPSPAPVRTAAAEAPVVAAALQVENAKPVVKRTVRRPAQASGSRPRRAKSGAGIMDRMHLGWLRNAFTVRREPL
jgi:hypothetical protein